MRNLATDVILYGKIKTTETKAKKLKRIVDRLITYGKKQNLAGRREAKKFLRDKVDAKGQSALQKLFTEIAPKYLDRQGGYTRILKLENRRGDNTLICLLELV